MPSGYEQVYYLLSRQGRSSGIRRCQQSTRDKKPVTVCVKDYVQTA